MDIAKVKREKRLRRQILALVESNRATPWTNGLWAKDLLESSPEGIRTAEEMMQLSQDLVNCQLLEVRDTRTLKRDALAHGDELLKFMEYRVTAKGTALLAGAVPVEPLVEDERI